VLIRATAVLLGALLTGGCSAAPARPQPAAATGETRPPPVRSAGGESPAPSPPPPPAGPTEPTATANAAAAALTDEQLIGQLFMTYVYGSAAEQATPAERQANIALYGEPTPAAVVARWHLGGIILVDQNDLDPDRPTLSTGNIRTAEQLRELTAGLQAAAQADTRIPLLIATDQEGGRVQRLRGILPAQPAQRVAAELSPGQLRCQYATMGQQLWGLGINEDFAPVADVVRTATGVIGDRSFGPDPDVDARDVALAVTGLQQAGVLATLKHWPGHGSTSTDSHAALAVITESADQWRAVDRAAFAAAASTAAAVMVGHLALPALDPTGQPATLSTALVDGALRTGLGYRGLVVTDSLWMQPMRAAGDPADVADRAVHAGNDVLLEPPDLPGAYQALLDGVRRDPPTRATATAAVARTLTAKSRAVPTGGGGC
jgi:beta-N-acetylhexosaminidase